jgi:hypothetical protein
MTDFIPSSGKTQVSCGVGVFSPIGGFASKAALPVMNE